MRKAANELAGVDFDRSVGFLHAHAGDSLRGVRPRNDFERSVGWRVARRKRVRGPLEGTVRPVSQRPALQWPQFLVCATQGEILRFALFAAWPRRSPGDALRNGAKAAIEPAHPGTGARVGHGYLGGGRTLRSLIGDHSKGRGSGSGVRNELPSRNALLHWRSPPFGASCSHRIVIPDRICTMLIEPAKLGAGL